VSRTASSFLGYADRGGADHPLAKGFDIMDGRSEVVVPDVKPGDYAVVCEFQSELALSNVSLTLSQKYLATPAT